MPSGQRETAVSLPLMPTRSDLYWRRIFKKYDKDNDGRISYVELKGIIESQEYDHDLPENVVDKIMALADSDNSRYLNSEEFVAMIRRPDTKAMFGHFVARYVHSIIPRRNPVDTTGQRDGVEPVPLTESGECRSKAYFTYIDGAYEKECSCWPPPICMILISLVEIVLFCYDAAQGKTRANGPAAMIFMYDPAKRWEAWRFITYMLVHRDVFHLAVNLLMQVFVAVTLEMVHGWWRVFLVYLTGVAAGSLAFSLTETKGTLVGASGGVYALMTAHFATVIMNWSEMDLALIQPGVLMLYVVWDFFRALYYRYWAHVHENIGYAAHFGGAVAGLLVGIGVLRNLEKRKWEKRLWWAAVVLYTALMAAGILANIFWTARFQESSFS